jgi:hypothetical protein
VLLYENIKYLPKQMCKSYILYINICIITKGEKRHFIYFKVFLKYIEVLGEYMEVHGSIREVLGKYIGVQ